MPRVELRYIWWTMTPRLSNIASYIANNNNKSNDEDDDDDEGNDNEILIYVESSQ